MSATPETEINLSEIVLSLYIFLKKKLKVIFTVFAIVFALAITLYLIFPKVYRSQLIATTDILNYSHIKASVEVLDKLLGEQNNALLESKLNMRTENTRLIKSIEVAPIIEVEENEEEKIQNYIITAYVSDPKVFNSLEKDLVKYFNHNEYIEKKIKIKRENLENLRDYLRTERKRLADFQQGLFTILTESRQAGSSFSLDNPGSIAEINKAAIGLYEQELEITADLLFVDDFKVIQGFPIYEKSYSPRLSITLIVAFLSSIVISILILIVLRLEEVMNTKTKI